MREYSESSRSSPTLRASVLKEESLDVSQRVSMEICIRSHYLRFISVLVSFKLSRLDEAEKRQILLSRQKKVSLRFSARLNRYIAVLVLDNDIFWIFFSSYKSYNVA